MVEQESGVPRPTGGGNRRPRPGIRWFGVVLLVAYVALLGIGTVSLWRIVGDGIAAWIATGAFLVLFVGAWRRWLAPGSRHRLAFQRRVTTHLVAGPAVVVLAALGGVGLPAVVALSVLVMGDALDERDSPPTVPAPDTDLI